MGHICWDFPLKGTGNEQGYTNSGIETFNGKELIENLAREICQNSLDAKNPEVAGPVLVKFEVRQFQQSRYALFEEYRECLEGCKANWAGRMDERLKDFLSGADSMLAKPQIPVLVASDYNTKGLEGVTAPENEQSPWRALAHSDGTSVAKSEDSAGSYGIGKNAPFACTALSTVFYNTYAIDGGRAFQGTARLATIKKNGRKTQGVGHYLYLADVQSVEDEDCWRPIGVGDNCPFFDEFKRDTFGTDIIVVGFSEEDSWIDRMTRAIVSNFFLAIYQNKLVVEIQGTKIDSTKLGEVIDQYKDAKTVETKAVYEWYQALITPDNDEILRLSVLEDDDVALYVKANSEYHNRVAYFRSSGMRIRIAKPISYQNFAAVVVIEKERLNKLLRKAEPVRHNKWDPTLIKNNPAQKKQAKECLEKLDGWLRDELRKKYELTGLARQDSGEGDYLPDDADAERDQQGDDALRVRQKLSSSRSSISSSGNIHTGAGTGTGTPVPGASFGKKKRRKKKKGKKVVTGGGTTHGATPTKSGPPLSAVNLSMQSSFLIKEEYGLYKVILCAEHDYPKVLLSFNAIGEDSEEDLLTIEKFAYKGVTTNVNKSVIGPIALTGGDISELFVTFENKEKMRLNLMATEV